MCKKYAHLNMDIKWGNSYTNQEKMGQSYTVSLEKGGLSYTWQSSKRVLFGPRIRTMSFIGTYPPPRAENDINFQTIYLSLLSRSSSDHHLRCGGWLNLEFSKREKTFRMGH